MVALGFFCTSAGYSDILRITTSNPMEQLTGLTVKNGGYVDLYNEVGTALKASPAQRDYVTEFNLIQLNGTSINDNDQKRKLNGKETLLSLYYLIRDEFMPSTSPFHFVSLIKNGEQHADIYAGDRYVRQGADYKELISLLAEVLGSDAYLLITDRNGCKKLYKAFHWTMDLTNPMQKYPEHVVRSVLDDGNKIVKNISFEEVSSCENHFNSPADVRNAISNQLKYEAGSRIYTLFNPSEGKKDLLYTLPDNNNLEKSFGIPLFVIDETSDEAYLALRWKGLDFRPLLGLYSQGGQSNSLGSVIKKGGIVAGLLGAAALWGYWKGLNSEDSSSFRRGIKVGDLRGSLRAGATGLGIGAAAGAAGTAYLMHKSSPKNQNNNLPKNTNKK